MEYALYRGFTIALIAALGAACADACFGTLAGLGLTLLTEWLILNSCWLQFCGGVFLCILGAQLFFFNKQELTLIPNDTSALGVFSSTFFLTLANPLTILAFMALFGYFGLANLAHHPKYASVAISGIFTGSLTWWTLLIYGMTRLKPYFTLKALVYFRQLGGITLILFGTIAIIRSF
jgi:threonine/homoserine/homoserine lactone efflux protein